MTSLSVSYKRHRFPPAINRACGVVVLSLPAEPSPGREMLLERGIVVSYETMRRWAMKFGRDYARRLKRKRARRRDIWRLDEVIVTIGGKQHWLWRAVDQDGYILDEIVQTRRDAEAAKRLLTRLLKKQGWPPRRMITDKLGSYAAARRQIMPAMAADDRGGHGLAKAGVCAETKGHREHAGGHSGRRHDDWPRACVTGVNDRVAEGQPAIAQAHDRVLHQQN
jgi:transposase-like protein